METTNDIQNVQMTADEMAEFEKFRRDRERRAQERQRRENREAYAALVDETIERAMPQLTRLSGQIAAAKAAVQAEFNEALRLKAELFGVRDDQRSHTFTNAAGDMRITLGRYTLDSYRDTVEDGIAKVRQYIESLAKDADTQALVRAVLRLMAKDQTGALKASRVLQLRKMAEESGNDTFIEGVRIIEESYQPQTSKQFVRAEIKDPDTGAWQPVPLGMTEA